MLSICPGSVPRKVSSKALICIVNKKIHTFKFGPYYKALKLSQGNFFFQKFPVSPKIQVLSMHCNTLTKKLPYSAETFVYYVGNGFGILSQFAKGYKLVFLRIQWYFCYHHTVLLTTTLSRSFYLFWNYTCVLLEDVL